MAIIASTGKGRNWVQSLRRVTDIAWWGHPTANVEQAPDVLNGEYLQSVNAAGTGVNSLIGCGTGTDTVTLPNGVTIPSGAALTIANGASVVGASNLASTATITVSSADILNAGGIAKVLVAAPGSGLAIVPLMLLFEITTTATVYANGGALSCVWTGGSTAVLADTIPASVVNAVAGTSYTLIQDGAHANGLTVLANTGLTLYSGTAFTSGTGTAKVQLWYVTITL